MEFNNVTFACDDEGSLKHTKVFNNKNLFQCYHHNRGYCTFRDKCRYKHFRDICGKTICREQECDKRHPVICRYRDDCKFNKINKCAFKHINTKINVASLDFENKMNEEIESLKREIVALKNVMDSKEEELLKNKMEIKHQISHIRYRMQVITSY